MDPKHLETQSKEVFGRLNTVEAPPYLARRVVARSQERSRTVREVRVWRWVAALSVTAVLAITVALRTQHKAETFYTMKPYVLQVGLEDLRLADSAEIDLPDGLTFVSANEDIQTARTLRLPVSLNKEGKPRLPFVVRSEKSGQAAVQVRIYDSEDRLIQTKTLNLSFETGV